MTTPVPRGSLWPDFWDLLESPLSALRPLTGQTIRVEDGIRDDRYVIRAELPGIDPEKDVDITVESGILTIRAERREERKEARRSEFRYGSLLRSLTLPTGVDEHDVKATYDKGILEVSFAMPRAKKEARRVPIEPGG